MKTFGSVEPGSGWKVERDDSISILRYDGGERRTMGIDQAAELAGLVAQRASQAEPPVLILIIDVLHAELGEVRQMSEGRPIADWAPWLAAISGLADYPSASIVVVESQASCGGLELALAADIRVASPQARLGVLETRMGLMPGAGGTQRLPKLVGIGYANLMVLTGETISGSEAHRVGLVQLLDDDPRAKAIQVAERLAQIGPAVLETSKGALAAARSTDVDGFRIEGKGFLKLAASEAGKASMDRWLAAQAARTNPALDPSPLP